MAKKGDMKVDRVMSTAASSEHELKSRPGGSNAGEYSHVSPENFAGNACGLPGSYPIDTMDRAKSALALAHNAKDPECIRRQVYKKWPSLKPSDE